MDPTLISTAASLADKLTSFALVLVILVAGARGYWVYGPAAKERLKERDDRIKRLEEKLETQERLIDRLSGLAERSTELARPLVMRDVQETRSSRSHAAATER